MWRIAWGEIKTLNGMKRPEDCNLDLQGKKFGLE